MSPLTEKLRPNELENFIGQEHLVGKNGPLRKLLESGSITSMIFWGPPGCGKTTLARIIPQYVDMRFVPFSAVTGGLADVRKIIAEAKDYKKAYNKDTILFIDEIHRFNKSQQDAFLPHVEYGTIILVGATTENPGFEVNAPLVSRSQIYIFKQLSDEDIKKLINKALTIFPNNKWSEEAKNHLVVYSNGDARKAINSIEIANKVYKTINLKEVENILQRKSINYDKSGDSHYDTISAFIKSMRGSKPDATLHYLARMLKAGEQAEFIARRMVIFASEDIGNARPAALILATSCMQAVKMIGMPEAQIILAQCATYLATCPKSIASYIGLEEALKDLENNRIEPIPLHLRNAENKVMQDFKYGKGHIRYPWLESKKGNIIDQEYMPENLKEKIYYKFKELSENSEKE